MIMRHLLLLTCCFIWLSLSLSDSCSHLSDGYSNYGTSCFKLYELRKTWVDAEASCVADGGHLASIHSTGEQHFMASLLVQNTWMGLTGTKSSMGWSDETNLDYENWEGNNPDESGQSCGRLKKAFSYKWGDRPCTFTYQYICRLDMLRQAFFIKVPTGVAVDSTVDPSSTHIARSRIECAHRCQQDGNCLHFIMTKDGADYFCRIYALLKRPVTSSTPSNNYQKIV